MKRLLFLALGLVLSHAADAQEVRNPATLGTITGTLSQSQLPSGYAAPTAHGVIIGEDTSAPVAVGPCGTAGQILGYPTTSADPQCLSQKSPIHLGSASVAQNLTQYIVPGTTVVQSGVAGPTVYAGTIRSLRVHTLNAPGAGQTFTFTIVTSPTFSGSVTPTAVTCQITAGLNDCSDAINSAAITANGYWSLQVQTSPTSGATGQVFASVEYDTP